LPIAGYTALYLLDHRSFDFGGGESAITETNAGKPSGTKPATSAADKNKQADTESRDPDETLMAPPPAPAPESAIASGNAQNQVLMRGLAEPMAKAESRTRDMAQPKVYAPSAVAMPAPVDMPAPQAENRDRIEDFKSNPVRSALEDP